MNTNSRLFAPLVWLAVISWFVLIYFEPLCMALPIVIGGIVEFIWPYSLRKKPVDSPKQ